MDNPVATNNPFAINPKVSVYTIVMVLMYAVINTAKLHNWFDLTADATVLSTSLGALAAYWVKAS